MRSLLLAFVLGAGAVAPLRTAHATTLVPLSTRDLLLDSDLIVVGTVVASETRWIRPIGLIVTDVTIAVERRAKGKLESKTLVVRQPGGRVGSVVQDVDGAPIFETGGEVLLFLERAANTDVHTVMGLSQGKVDLLRDATGRLVMERTIQEKKVRGLRKVLAPQVSVLYVDDFLDHPEVDLE